MRSLFARPGTQWARIVMDREMETFFRSIGSGSRDAEQVLEHVRRPYRAVRNVWEMLRPGGIFAVNTPFLIRVHEDPEDYSRWTEKGLRQLLVEGGFEESAVQTGSWGNRACVRATLSHWAGWIPWMDSLENEPQFPVVVWAEESQARPPVI